MIYAKVTRKNFKHEIVGIVENPKVERNSSPRMHQVKGLPYYDSAPNRMKIVKFNKLLDLQRNYICKDVIISDVCLLSNPMNTILCELFLEKVKELIIQSEKIKPGFNKNEDLSQSQIKENLANFMVNQKRER